MTLTDYLETTGTTETAFAAALGVSQVTVHRYVKGKRFPDKDTILRVEVLTKGAVRPADWFAPNAAPAPSKQGAAA